MTEEFEFKEIDKEGIDTLQTIVKADRFNKWMYSTFADYCKGEILEIGSGIGTLTSQLIADGKELYASDIRQSHLDVLQERIGKKNGLKGCIVLDVADPDFDKKHAKWMNHFDTIFAMNIIEHVKDDELALRNLYKLLKPGGKVIILVPAHQALYNRFDKELQHYRRYSSKQLGELLTQARFSIIKKHAFNFMGIFGWWFSGSVLGKKSVPDDQMRLFNTLVPVFRLLDVFTARKIGLSVIAIGEK